MPASSAAWTTASVPAARPTSEQAAITATTMTRVGSAVASRLIARPWMTLVPWPVSDALAIDFTGR